MSGHSKWHKIKHQKEATDKKKGQLFGRIAKELAVLARTEKDPAKNAQLRDAITRAKKVNMPQANIDRLLSGTGKLLTASMYEGFGPGGSALIVLTETDNTNRTFNEIRTIFRDHHGTLGTPGTANWKFATQTILEASDAKVSTPAIDEIELALIDAGATDINIDKENNLLIITANPENQTKLEEVLRRFEIEIQDSKIAHLPNQPVTLKEEELNQLKELIEALENHQDVLEVFTDAT